MHLTNILPLCIVLAAFFAYLNYKVIRWPPAIGIMVLALVSSVILVMLRGLNIALLNQLANTVNAINFKEVLLNFMLSFLLFAGAIHLDAKQLYKERLPVIVLALFGTIISAVLVGYLTWLLFGWFNYPIPLIYCFIFGTIISPTDPVAVLSILREAKSLFRLKLKLRVSRFLTMVLVWCYLLP